MSRNLSKYFSLFLLFSSLILPIKSWAAIGNFESVNKNSKVRLIATYKKSEDEKNKILIGFQFQLEKGWKIYGKSDSSFVQEPILEFLPSSNNINIKDFNILWPKAKIVEETIINETISYPVYEDNIVIPIELEVLDFSKETIIDTKITYGLCKDICIPVEQNLKINLKSSEIDQNALTLTQVSETTYKEEIIKSAKMTLLSAIIVSFIGGLILNIMPCVLPVLSIKLLSIIKHSKSSLKNIRIAFASTIFGILFCFTFFAVIISSLKMLGTSIGWGAQFQSPYFLIFLVLILTIFTANLLGMLEVRLSSYLGDVIDDKIKKSERKDGIFHIFITNFLSGILAVLLATPCSAPFLGTAISFAFVQDSLIIFTIFIFMALGLAFPYIFLMIFPKAVKLLPKPGAWMEKVKIIMAGFLIATIIWLIFILSNNIGFVGAMVCAILSTLIFLCFRLCQKFQLSKIKEIIIILVIFIVTMIIPIKISKYFMSKEAMYDGLWMKFEEEKIHPYIATNNVVIIDITADWCITCKLNKKLVLDSKEIVAKLKEPNIIPLRGDLTKPNQDIFEFMASHNRYAIPFNIVYGPNAKNGILLSELLSKKELLKAIQTAK